MIKLMNSAMMPQPGIYEMEQISQQVFASFIRDAGEVDSYIGYPQTAQHVEALTGINVEVSRRMTLLEDGDRVLVVKLPYRVADPAIKGNEVAPEFEYFLVRYRD